MNKTNLSVMIRSSLRIACLLLVSTSLWAASKGRKEYEVDFTVEDSNGTPKLTIWTPPGKNKCSRSKAQNGCVAVEQNHTGDIYFKIRGNPKCDRSNHWQLDEVQLAGEGYADKPPAQEWTTKKVDLNDYVVEDFNADKVSGKAGVGIDAAKKRIWIHSKNRTTLPQGSAGTNGYHIWYRVRATCAGNAATAIYSDPSVRNKGNR